MKRKELICFNVFVLPGRGKAVITKPNIYAETKLKAQREAVKLHGKKALTVQALKKIYKPNT